MSKKDAKGAKLLDDADAQHMEEHKTSATSSEVEINHDGLSETQATELRNKHGFNELEEVIIPLWRKFLGYFLGPIPYLMELAFLIALVVYIYCMASGEAGCDVATWVVLFVLLFVNSYMGFSEESKSQSAIAALKASMAPLARVRRDKQWQEIAARLLVPGDLIILKLGDIIAADCKLHHGAGGSVESMEVDQAALTGESLPAVVHSGDVVYAGSVIKRGELHATVFATGKGTFFGKAASLVASVNERGNLQKILLKIAYFMMFSGSALVIILYVTIVAGPAKQNAIKALISCLALLVASIPIAMQVVTTATMAVGARQLSENNAIVARLAAIEELAGMTILCSDKTGTLTKNKLSLDPPECFEGTEDDLLLSSAIAAKWEGQDAIDKCLTDSIFNKDFLYQHKQEAFIPFDPVIKRTECTVRTPSGLVYKVTKGAPQVIADLSYNANEIRDRVDDVIEQFGSRGFRAIGVGKMDMNTQEWHFLGLIPLFDPPRDDTKSVIEQALAMGVEVKMVTGDHLTIAKETARRLGMGTNIYTTSSLLDGTRSESQLRDLACTADGFAQVFPEHKFKVVELIQQAGHLTGMTGDGVNDAPALKKANVGIAVQGATDAARLIPARFSAAADIVLLSEGLGVIILALVKAREIFLRMKAYVIYRIACTICLLMFVFFSQILFNAKAPVTPVNIAPSTPYWYGYPFLPDFTAFNFPQTGALSQTSNPVLVDFERVHGYQKPTDVSSFYNQFSSATTNPVFLPSGLTPSTLYKNILQNGAPPLFVQLNQVGSIYSPANGNLPQCGSAPASVCSSDNSCKSWSVTNAFSLLGVPTMTGPACWNNCGSGSTSPCHGDVFVTQYVGNEGQSTATSYAANNVLGQADNSLYQPQSAPTYPHFGMPAIVLVILTILNDGTIISIAYDYVVASPKPEKWSLGIVLVVCSVLGGIAFAELFLFYILIAGGTTTYIGKGGELTNAEVDFYGSWAKRQGAWNANTMSFDVPSTPMLPLTQGQVTSAIYLLLSMGGQAIVFQARTDSWFFSRKPGFALGVAFMTSQTISILFSNFWFFGDLLEPIGLNVWTTCPGASPYQSLIQSNFQKYNSLPAAQRTFFAPTLLVKVKDSTGVSFKNMPVWAQFATSSSAGLCLMCNNNNAFGNGVDIDMTATNPAGTYANPLTCFQHGSPNSWVIGLTFIWAAGWFLGGDIAKVITYYLINNYYLDMAEEDKALDQRKQQKRLSVAVDIERRATMAGNVRRSLVKKTQTVTPGGGHASAAHGAGGASSSELQALNSKVSKLSQDVGQIATKVTALEQEQAALRGLVQP